jgi:hypothetical protein
MNYAANSHDAVCRRAFVNRFNPFAKDLKTLVAADLSVLRDVPEGWYIEYKREVPNANSIAKSVSAFANTYGGWLFYGIEENSKEEPVAGSFPGIIRAEVDGALQRIRQAVASQLNPTPHFDCRVVWGDAEQETLAPDRGVICINVPWSPTAPHVHKSGQIYRRVSDGSEPRPENDRHVLHQLFHRGDDIRESYKRWVSRDPEFSKGEEKRPYLRLLFTADLWDDRGSWLDADINEIRQIMGRETGALGAVPFDTVYPSAKGFIARQSRNNDPHNLALTWRLSRSLDSDIVVPLDLHEPDNARTLLPALDGYEHAKAFIQLLEERRYETIRVVDLTPLFTVILGLLNTHKALLERAGWGHGFYVKARLLNVWRTTPFMDVPLVMESFEKFGVPTCLDGSVTAPPGDDPESFFEVPRLDETESDDVRLAIQGLLVFAAIASAFGLPSGIESARSASDPLKQFLEAGNRAIAVSRKRLGARGQLGE